MFTRRLLTSLIKKQNVRYSGGTTGNYMYNLEKIGKREVVGYGFNGDPTYLDRYDFPMPAIRFKEDSPDIKILRTKEKGDWKKLTIDEKKALYRASFCQTFAEMNAPTGEWKTITGWTLFWTSCGLWLFILFKIFIYPPLPESFSEESRLAQLERMMIMNVNPVTGISSEKWKK